MPFTPDSRLADALDDPAAAAILRQAVPGLADSPLVHQIGWIDLAGAVSMFPTLGGDAAVLERMWEQLARLEAGQRPERVHGPAIEADAAFEGSEVARGSATVSAPATVRPWQIAEVVLTGPSHGNPFVDVELVADVEGPDGPVVVGGFYDGDGTYRLRLLPSGPGTWTVTTRSTARSLDGVVVTVECAGEPVGPGPVRVADAFHFAHADGTRHVPLGTTAYAWTHQGEALEQATLATLADGPFTKLRMCVFPKAYLYNLQEPVSFPFPRAADGSWDVTRFDVEFFRHLESRVADLAALGIQADVILFHPYDRWGFSDLGPAVDERYARYVVRRLAAHANVWWSLANEYDLVRTKVVEDWERIAEVVTGEDPWGHLTSIHQCFGFYDHTRPWITHASVQRVDVYRTAENVDAWRRQWGKPVVVDECGYEGDLDQGWGNLTGQEMVRRFWEGAVRGGYVGHGETYLNDREELWWSKGGELVGTSPSRIGFLREVMAALPGGVLDPAPSDWDVPWAVSPDASVHLLYLGGSQPRFRTLVLPPGRDVVVDVIDTWAMTVERVPGVHRGFMTVPLPGQPFMAVRLTSVGPVETLA